MSRVRGPVAPPPSPRSTAPATKQGATSKTDNAAGRQPAVDTSHTRAEEVRLSGAMTRARVTGNAGFNSASVQSSADRVLGALNRQGDPRRISSDAARVLAQELRNNPSPEFHAQLIGYLQKRHPKAFEAILRGSEWFSRSPSRSNPNPPHPISADDRKLIAQALGSAHARGQLDVNQLVAARMPAAIDLVRQSGSNRLVEAYATTALQNASQVGGRDQTVLMMQAARVMSGNPQVLERVVGQLQQGKLGVDLNTFVDRIGHNNPFNARRSDYAGRYLADLLKTASGSNFATKLALFDAVAREGGSLPRASTQVRNALANLFASDSKAFIEHFSDAERIPKKNGSHDIEEESKRMQTLTRFFRETLFIEGSSDRQARLHKALETAAQEIRRTRGEEKAVVLLGRLGGSISNAFREEVRERGNSENARKEALELLFGSLAGFVENPIAASAVEFATGKLAEYLAKGKPLNEGQSLHDLQNFYAILFGVTGFRDTTPANAEHDPTAQFRQVMQRTDSWLEGRQVSYGN